MELGNLDSKRDWGYAKDYVECMWMILQHDTPEDFVIATGEQHTVRDFTEKAFAANGIELRWEGEGLNEKGYDKATGKMLVCVNPAWFRPTDVDNLGRPDKGEDCSWLEPAEDQLCRACPHYGRARQNAGKTRKGSERSRHAGVSLGKKHA